MTDYKIIEQTETGRSNCLECGSVLYGRADKRFCCESCKNRYHNKRYQAERNLKLRVKTILDRNYAILSSLISEKIISVCRLDLQQMGFNIDYMTAFSKINKHECCSCYDITFVRTPSRIYDIRKVSLKKGNSFLSLQGKNNENEQ